MQGVGGRGRAPGGRPGHATSPTGSPRPRTRGAWIHGADADAEQRYDAADLTGPTVLVLGSEGRGIRPRVAAACDQLVSIPVAGKVASLNVSAAAAVLIFEAVRQRQAGR